MQTALKLETCACGIHTDCVCSGCGSTVCTTCGHVEITSVDARNISIAHYCTACAANPQKNRWGTIYWEGLAALYT